MGNPFDVLLSDDAKAEAKVVSLPMVTKSGRYTLGPPKRPDIRHDRGFLDKFPPRDPTAADRAQFAFWVAVLEGSEALCNSQTGKYIDQCGNDDLSDANAAYRHFLFGNGAARNLNYERFVQGDPTGGKLIEGIFRDFQIHSEAIGANRLRFSVTGEVYGVGGKGGFVGYPETVNWQKAIGGHVVWVAAEVTVGVVGSKIRYSANMVISAEDMYNFNPGAADVNTGIPDSANGIFEVTGLAKQYLNFGSINRTIEWSHGDGKGPVDVSGDLGRQRKPTDNRRIRNRL